VAKLKLILPAVSLAGGKQSGFTTFSFDEISKSDEEGLASGNVLITH